MIIFSKIIWTRIKYWEFIKIDEHIRFPDFDSELGKETRKKIIGRETILDDKIWDQRYVILVEKIKYWQFYQRFKEIRLNEMSSGTMFRNIVEQ